jgi:transcriptional accessory protein Tex/SPT6
VVVNMGWEDTLKTEYPEILWTDENKISAYVDGMGPYTKDSILAELKRRGTFDNRREFISVRGGQIPTESAWEY